MGKTVLVGNTRTMSQSDRLANLVPPGPDLSALPTSFHIGGTPLFGLVLIAAGVIGPLVIGGILGLIGLVAQGLPAAWGWIVLAFAAGPLLAIPWGWWIMNSRTVVELGPETVSYHRKTPLRGTSWEAPLSEYTAVVYRRVLPPSSSKTGTTRHGVELRHGAGKHTVRLVQSSEEGLARATQARLAELTGLPATEDSPVRG
ncbi:hypothetical protein [Frigidibacter sp. ROC022]|uniref:hypothetical protein n=1 Tax=Frigidibacter sp. ROC022 TaxID=2971796 RepID=UPI00215A3139|nr:hypothetical protein [Frigidibacter sp. ROC022]MCR8725907.1 hypothetical protein [Frigidibacter sp. ROC022]